MKNNSKAIFYLSILLSAVLWGTVGLFFQALSGYELSRMEIVFMRSGIAAVLLFVFLLIFSRSKLKIRLKDLWVFVGTGIVSLLCFNYFYFSAMELTSISVAAVLLYTAPAFVTVLSAIIFKERLTKRKVFALLLTLPGCAIVSGLIGSGAAYSLEGILFGLGAGFCYALYTIFGRFALERGYHSLTISFYTFLLAGGASALLCSPVRVADALSAPPVLLLGVGLSICTCLLPYLLYTYGLGGVGNSEASITATIEPVAAMFFSVVFLGEALTIEKVIGIVLIVGAVVIINIRPSQKAAQRAQEESLGTAKPLSESPPPSIPEDQSDLAPPDDPQAAEEDTH